MLTAFRRLILTIALTGSVCFQLALALNQNSVIFHDAFMEREREPVTQTSGTAFKGPFAIGSTVTLAVLTESLSQTGTTFSGVVNTANGQYRISANIPDAPVEMIVRGFFFNEVTNSPSATELNLRAITRSNSTVNINLLTALEAERVRSLVASGQSFDEAKEQALSELMTSFGFSTTATDSTQIDLNSGDGQALLAITATLMTKPDGTSRSVNELQALVTQLTDDISDGTLSSARQELIFESAAAVDPTAFRNNLAGHFASNGSNISVSTFASALETTLAQSGYKVTVSSGSGGVASPSGVNWIKQGQSIAIGIVPNTGYTFAGAEGTCQGEFDGTQMAYQISSLEADCTVSLTFELKTYLITNNTKSGGSVSPSDNLSVKHGKSLEVTLTPSAGFSVAGVEGTCRGTLESSFYRITDPTGDCEFEILFLPTWRTDYVHCGTPTEVKTVRSPATGRVWMDRNLGATKVAESLTDGEAIGSYFQHGRFADGHQCADSEVWQGKATTAVPFTGAEWDGKSISTEKQTFPGGFDQDWFDRTLFPEAYFGLETWRGGTPNNNPCPAGFRLPTSTEWKEELEAWDPASSNGAFHSFLQLPATGYRSFGTANFIGPEIDGMGYYRAQRFFSLIFGSDYAPSNTSVFTAHGTPVRCIRDF